MYVVFLVNALFRVRPNDTVVVQGYTTYLNCSIRGMPDDIRWFHYALGARPDQNTEIYTNVELVPTHAGRIGVGKTSGASANLIFSPAKFSDAGTYACIEDSSSRNTSAQLIVLGKHSPTSTLSLKDAGYYMYM